ncbi:FAD/NAD(P)-binding domain-containing protein [Piedraia hortae CBS 480.64]|uniref:NADPH:adrenodoxin oxidoreductase, mitochondrial n=1 Tax=Piedraia hortae CBS 480.64 TaxID=1314780 RepID=A0A6A7C550_9PEZI|nr:FAD/NAD(P)-binding domain-containing protein [Piedraia hortae CBS 480.64]
MRRRTLQIALPLRRHVTTTSSPLNIAVIGSGPAGYYTTHRLLQRLPTTNFQITLLERLPCPYGLVRYGVAPDHEEVKTSGETLTSLAREHNGRKFHFIGNVSIGDSATQLPLRYVQQNFNVIILAYGASEDRKLNIPGESLRGVHSARDFVGWYNGHPDFADAAPNLDCERAVVLGQGNVALDVARILTTDPTTLRKTDIPSHALKTLSESKIREVQVIGRRGPLQAPFAIAELRELLTLPGLGYKPPPEPWEELVPYPEKELPRQLRRIVQLLKKHGDSPAPCTGAKWWQLGFLRSPVEFLSTDSTNLSAIGFDKQSLNHTALTGDPEKDLYDLRSIRVVPTGEKTLVHSPLAFRSIGYRSTPLSGLEELGVEFDEIRGIVPNDPWGRVMGKEGRPVKGLYCAGWVKRGPTGVIARTMEDAFATADSVVKDYKLGVLGEESKGGFDGLSKVLKERNLRPVSWDDWLAIDKVERQRGGEKGKEREKLTSVWDMVGVLGG